MFPLIFPFAPAARGKLTLVPKARGASLRVHMEKLPDAKTREAMREHWSRVLAKIAKD
jgi:hypothetical protein